MGKQNFVNVDRSTPMLLPPDLRDWVEDDDLAHFVLEAVGACDLSLARVNARGTGSAQYPPAMMLAVLLYCYATGTFSSRAIETLTYRNVSVRYLAANHHPDHDTLCKFRRENHPLIKEVFTQVLRLAGALNLAQMGTICIDGTKILASASKRRTFNREQLEQQELRLNQQIDELLARAETADQAEADDATRLPEELKGRQKLRDRVQQAREQLRAQVEERAREREADRQAWKKEPIGDCPRKRSTEPGKSDRINLSDPQSALMPLAGGGYAQGYNAQLAVSAELHSIIVASAVCTQTNDRQQLEPMGEAAVQVAGEQLKTLCVDNGYDSPRQIHALEERSGVEVICAQKKKNSTEKAPSEDEQEPPTGSGAVQGEATESASPPSVESRTQARQALYHKRSKAIGERMAERARSKEGRRLLRLRRVTVEPVFGIIKSVLGFRRFMLRGLEKVKLEWELVAVAFNCRRLSRFAAARR